MTKKTKNTDTQKKSFWEIRSIKTAFIVRGFELILLTAVVSIIYFYYPDWNLFYVFSIGVPLVLALSFLLYKEIVHMNSKDENQIAANNQDSAENGLNGKKERNGHFLTNTGLILGLSAIVSILVNILIFGKTANDLYTLAQEKITPKNIQIVVNALNIIVSFSAMILFIGLYKKSSHSSVLVKNETDYRTITDPEEEEDLRKKIDNNLIRTKNLENQFILFITLFAISLVAVYLAIIVHSYITPQEPYSFQVYLPEYQAYFEPVSVRGVTPFDFITNIINFSGALFIFLAFKVLHDDTLHSDNTSWTNFWVYPIFISFMYLLGVGLLYLVCSKFDGNNEYKEKITIALNLADLAAGLANGLTMTLLFGRYVSIEQSVRHTEKFNVKRENLIKKVSYNKLISNVIIWILPIYALAQPLFGSLTIKAFGDAKIFQTCVFAICLIGKIFFFIITYLLIKENLMNLYMHGVVAKVGDFKALEKCLNFDDSKKTPAV